jgi:hypothetical protein
MNEQGEPIVPRSRTRGAAAAAAALAAALAAGLAFAVAGCSQALPLGPAPSAPPTPVRLTSSIVMQPGLADPGVTAADCPAGSVVLSGPGVTVGQPAGSGPVSSAVSPSPVCFRKQGAPLTFTSAGVAVYEQPAGSQPVQHPASWQVQINLPRGEAAELAAITTKLAGTRAQLAIIIAGQTWGMPVTLQPLDRGQFVIGAQSKNQALQIQRLLIH